MTAPVEPSPSYGRYLWTPVGLMLLALATMWAIEIVDTVALDDRLQRNGLHPRERDGIDGILWAPFLHGGFRHLISNTIPFAILSGLVLVRGVRRWMAASAASSPSFSQHSA